MPDATSVSHTEFSRSRLSEVSMSLWIRLCNHTYIHTYIHAYKQRPVRDADAIRPISVSHGSGREGGQQGGNAYEGRVTAEQVESGACGCRGWPRWTVCGLLCIGLRGCGWFEAHLVIWRTSLGRSLSAPGTTLVRSSFRTSRASRFCCLHQMKLPPTAMMGTAIPMHVAAGGTAVGGALPAQRADMQAAAYSA